MVVVYATFECVSRPVFCVEFVKHVNGHHNGVQNAENDIDHVRLTVDCGYSWTKNENHAHMLFLYIQRKVCMSGF